MFRLIQPLGSFSAREAKQAAGKLTVIKGIFLILVVISALFIIFTHVGPPLPFLSLLPLSETTTTRAELYWDGASYWNGTMGSPSVSIAPEKWIHVLSSQSVRRGDSFWKMPSPSLSVFLDTEKTRFHLILGSDGAISLWDMGTDDQTRTYWYDSSAKIYQSALELFWESGGQSSSRDEFEQSVTRQMELDEIPVFCQDGKEASIFWPDDLKIGFHAKIQGVTPPGDTVELLSTQPMAGGKFEISNLDSYTSVTFSCSYTYNGVIIAQRLVDLKTGVPLPPTD